MEKLAATPIRRDVLLATGSDAGEHLNSQLTQDVGSLAVGSSAWAFLLEAKGEVVALLRVTKSAEDRFVLDTDLGLGSVVRDRIDGFLFRMDVSFESDTWDGLAVRGPGSSTVPSGTPVAMKMPWPGVDGLDLVGPQLPALEIEDLPADELEALRIRLGWPSMDDFDGKTTPAMTGIVNRTVSFTKGCYIGQEVVARMHYRQATPPRRLVQVGFHPCARPGPGDRIAVEGEDVGWLTTVSSHQPLALGYLQRSVESPVDGSLGDAPVCIGDLPVASIPVDAEPAPPTTSPLTLSN